MLQHGASEVEVKMMLMELEKVEAERDELKAQRDELLKSLRAALQIAHAAGCLCATCTVCSAILKDG